MRRARHEDPAAGRSPLGTDVDQVVGHLDDVEVVLDDDHRIAAIDEFVEHVEQQADILEVEARRRFVENIERAARIALRQLGGELDALALAARERRAGLAQREVAEPHLLDCTQLLVDRGDVLEKLHGHVHRHVEHVVDVAALVAHLERLAVVAVAAAGPAADIDVRKEVHLDGLDAGAAALLAAAALDVEREAARLETPDLGIGGHLEEFADVREDVGIGRRIGAGRASDGRLIDNDQLVDVLDALDRIVGQRLVVGAVERLRKDRAQGFVHERRFARAADSRHADELAERELGGDPLEVVAPGPADDDPLARARAQRGGNLDPPPAGQVVGRDAVGAEDVVEAPRGDDTPPLAAGAGAHIDDEVGGAHHVLVVLDDDHRVAGVAQLLEAADQPPVIALVKADRGLVEDVEDIDQLRADLRGQADALALAARERTRRAGERKVAQPHILQEAEPLADLLEDLLRDAALLVAHLLLDRGDPPGELRDGEGRDLGDVPARNAELERLLLQARAAADRAGAVDEELVAPLLAALRIVVLGAADVLGDALPLQELAAARGAELREIDRQRLRVAVEHGIEPLLREARDRVVEREVVAPAEHLQLGEEQVVAVFAQGFDGPLAQRKLRVGNDLRQVEDRLLAQSVAVGAGPLRGVEREGVRRRVLEGHARRGAHQVARVEALLSGAVVVDGHRALALAHRLLERGHQPVARVGRDLEAVHHQVDRVDLVAVEAHAGRDLADLAVDAGVDVALSGQRLEELPVVALAALDHRGHERDAPPVEAPEDEVGDLVVGVVDHLLARDGRIGPRGTRVEQTQEIVDLRDGAHGRAGVLVGGLLLDGHHRAQPRDLIDVGALHRPHELPRVGRERLHVAALPLGIDRVEGQRGLARAREARDDHQFAARDLQIDVLEVVHPRSVYLDRIFHRVRSAAPRKAGLRAPEPAVRISA